MEAAAIPAAVAHDDHHHGPPAAHHSSKVHPEQLGILLFIISELMLFAAFFAAMWDLAKRRLLFGPLLKRF